MTIGKLTFPSQTRGEQSLERLRRWHRLIRITDLAGVLCGPLAGRRLGGCATGPGRLTGQAREHGGLR